MLTKHSIVARLHEHQQSQRHVYFQYENDGDERREGVYLTRVNWDEMLQPTQITVTIEPGDQLTEAENMQQNELDRIPSRMPEVPLTMHSGF